MSGFQELFTHLRIHAVRTDGPFTLRSGEESSWYIDARQTTFDGRGAVLVGRAILSVLDPEVVAVGGMTMGADPMAVATAITADVAKRHLRAFSVRKSTKDHGIGGRLVGPVHPGDRVAVLDDTVTTGGALLEAIEVVVAAGLKVVQAVSLVDRSGGRVSHRLARAEIPYRSLATPADLGVDG